MARFLDVKLKGPLRLYALQVAIASLVLTLVLWAETLITHGVLGVTITPILIGSLGSTAAIIFMAPSSTASRPKTVLVSHLAALTCGGIVAVLGFLGPVTEALTAAHLLIATQGALAVGLTLFAMAATNTWHPPAAGTTLAFVTRQFDPGAAFFVVTGMLALVAAHQLVRSRLRDF